jgi:hypothetical protein
MAFSYRCVRGLFAAGSNFPGEIAGLRTWATGKSARQKKLCSESSFVRDWKSAGRLTSGPDFEFAMEFSRT